jgi:hypothetical protein
MAKASSGCRKPHSWTLNTSGSLAFGLKSSQVLIALTRWLRTRHTPETISLCKTTRWHKCLVLQKNHIGQTRRLLIDRLRFENLLCKVDPKILKILLEIYLYIYISIYKSPSSVFLYIHIWTYKDKDRFGVFNLWLSHSAVRSGL